MWISPQFKLYLIKEYQRLKAVENNQYNIEWEVKRVISFVPPLRAIYKFLRPFQIRR